MSNRSYNILKIILLSILLLFLCGFFISVMFFNGKHSNYVFGKNNEVNKVIDTEYSLSSVNSISASLRDADFSVKRSNTDNVKVVVYDKDDTRVNVKVNDGVLDIDVTGSYVCFGFCFNDRRIEVYLPDNYNGDIDLNSASGDISIPNLVNSNIKVKTASGDVKVNEANNIDIRTASGDVNVSKVNDIKVNTVSGEVIINNVTSINGSTTSGDLKIKDIKEIIEFTTVSGEIDITNANLVKNSRLSTVSGDVEIDMLNPIYVNVKTTSGDIDVRGDDRHSDIELYIKTTSGDVEIN